MKPASPVLHEVAGLTERNIGAGQPQYEELPALIRSDGMVTSRWHATWLERLQILFTGDVWLQQLTFNNKLQPVKLLADQPLATDCVDTHSKEI